jgi:DNA-binding response OmpR family regulator
VGTDVTVAPVDHIELVRDTCTVVLDGREVAFTPREFEILSLLVEREDRVVLRTELHEVMWLGPPRPRDRSVDVLIRRVRLKLAEVDPDREYIHTHYGIGYRFAPEPVADHP